MKQQTTALNTRRMSLFFYSRFSEKIGPPGLQKKFVKAPTLLLYLRVRWRPLSGISLLTEFGGMPLTAVMTFPERTDVVLGQSRGDFGSVCWLLAGCHWETASEMILVVAEAIRVRLA